MRKRTGADRKSKAAEVAGDGAEPKAAKRRERKTVASAKVEMPPAVGNEKAQQGSGGFTRASEIKMTGFENIIDSLFTFDADEVYDEVLASLELSSRASRQDYGDLVDALDAGEEIARKAAQLLANAKVASQNYQNDVKVLSSELHEQAVSELMAKYNDPEDETVTKKPTIADIEAYKVSNYHDEWYDMEERVSKAKRVVEYLESLLDIAKQRARDLRQMLASNRGA